MIAVVIPVYNRRDLLEEALNSLCYQTKKQFITVVVDDASTENIKEVTDKYTKKLHLVYLRQEKNRGPGMARQAGLDWCYSRNIELVTFMDGDDEMYPNAIQTLSYEINHNNADIVSSQICCHYDNKPGNIIEESNNTWTHGKMYRCNFLQRKNIRFDEGLRTNEDLSFNLRCSYQAEKGLIPMPLYLWRQKEGSITHLKETLSAARGVDYITAIYYVFKDFENDKKIISKLMPTIVNLYNYYQGAIVSGCTIPKKTNEQLKEIYNHPYVKKRIINPTLFWVYQDNIKPFLYAEKKIYWFKQTFEDWIKEFIK